MKLINNNRETRNISLINFFIKTVYLTWKNKKVGRYENKQRVKIITVSSLIIQKLYTLEKENNEKY